MNFKEIRIGHPGVQKIVIRGEFHNKSKQNHSWDRFTKLVLLFLFLTMIMILISTGSGDATITGTPIPDSPTTWLIDVDTIVIDENLTIQNQSIFVNPGIRLTVLNSTFNFNQNGTGKFFAAYRGGELIVRNSTLIDNRSGRTTIVIGYPVYSGTCYFILDNLTISQFAYISIQDAVTSNSSAVNLFINDSTTRGMSLSHASLNLVLFDRITFQTNTRDMLIGSCNPIIRNTIGDLNSTSGWQITGVCHPIFMNCTDAVLENYNNKGAGHTRWNYPVLRFYDIDRNMVDPEISIINESGSIKWTGTFISNTKSSILLPSYYELYILAPGSTRYICAVEQWYILWNGNKYLIPYKWNDNYLMIPYDFQDVSNEIFTNYMVTSQSSCIYPPVGNNTQYMDITSLDGQLYVTYFGFFGNYMNATYVKTISIAPFDGLSVDYSSAKILRRTTTETGYVGATRCTAFNGAIYVMWTEEVGSDRSVKWCKYWPGNDTASPILNMTTNPTATGDFVVWESTLWFLFTEGNSPYYWLHIIGLSTSGIWTDEYNYSTGQNDSYVPRGCIFNGSMYIVVNELSPNRMLLLKFDGTTFSNPDIILDSGYSWQRYASMEYFQGKLWIFFKSGHRPGIPGTASDIGLYTIDNQDNVSEWMGIITDNHYNSVPGTTVFDGQIVVIHSKERCSRPNTHHQYENDYVFTINGKSVSFSNVVNGRTVIFTDTSDFDGDEWLWDFDDGSTSNEQNPDHRFQDSGDYDITLTITDEEGASNSTTTTIHILSHAEQIDLLIPLLVAAMGVIIVVGVLGNGLIRPMNRIFRRTGG